MKTLIITGASRGIGGYIAARAHEEGYRIVGLARNATAGLPFEVRACDVSDPEQVAKTLDDLRRDEDLFGLINAAGIASMNLSIAMPSETAKRIVETNLLGVIHCCALIGKWLSRNKRGRIVNFSTIAVPLALKGEAVYVGSKAGVEAFSRSFAREMADFGVTVNTIAPGPIATDLIAKVGKEKIAQIVNQQIIQRQAKKEDVWNIISLLLDGRADMITGEVIGVGGS